MKSWVKGVTTEVVQVANNEQRAWFNKRIAEIKDIFNVAGLVGEAERDKDLNPYANHKAFVESMHQHKLGCEAFQVKIMEPLEELQEKIKDVDAVLKRKIFESDHEKAE